MRHQIKTGRELRDVQSVELRGEIRQRKCIIAGRRHTKQVAG
jgi:hypothetical protein